MTESIIKIAYNGVVYSMGGGTRNASYRWWFHSNICRKNK